MKTVYLQWIRENVKECTGACVTWTARMVREFPELKRVRGHYHCPFWGKREHWWCVAQDGSVVDPTVAQFPSKGMGEYIEHVEGSREPTGKCHDCGEYTYNGESFCSPACEAATMNYLGFRKGEKGQWVPV